MSSLPADVDRGVVAVGADTQEGPGWSGALTSGAPITGLPDVSVVIPTHNRIAHLRRTLTGVLAQQDVSLEVLVVDEASHDGTWEYLTSICDRRVRPIRHPIAQGVAAARNTGLAGARAPWVAFVDDDDLWAPTKLARQLLQIARTADALWSCTGSAVVDDQLTVHRLHPPPDPVGLADVLLSHNCIPGGGSGVVARTELVRKVGCFDTDLRNLADWDLWIRLALEAPLATVADPLIASVIHGAAASYDVQGSAAELEVLRVKYADECRMRRVILGGWPSGRYAAESYLRSGRRFSAAAVELRHAARHGRGRSLPWAALAVLSPAALGRRDRRRVKRNADPALATANCWLDAYRGTIPPSLAEAAGNG